MVIKPSRRIIATVALATALAGATASHFLTKKPSLIQNDGKKQELVLKEVLNFKKPSRFFDPEEYLSLKKHMSSEVASFLARKLSGFERVLFFNNLKSNQPRDVYFVLENYMNHVAEAYDLNPDIVKFLFFRRQFDLRNPIGIEDPRLIKKYAGINSDARIFNDDPFLGIDVAVRYLRDLAQKYRRTGTEQILTEYLYGPFRTGKQFDLKLRQTKKDLEKYRQQYSSLLSDLVLRAPGNYFYSSFDLRLENYPRYSLEQYRLLSEKDQKKILFDFAHFVAGQLGLDPEILLRVMKVESEFNNDAQNSSSKAIGLMQIKPILYEELKRKGIFQKVFGRDVAFYELRDPYINIVAGSLFLKYCLLNLNLDYAKALSAYNIGFSQYTSDPNGASNLGASRRYLDKVQKADLSQVFL